MNSSINTKKEENVSFETSAEFNFFCEELIKGCLKFDNTFPQNGGNILANGAYNENKNND